MKSRLVMLRRVELLRPIRKKKERALAAFHKDPFKFVKSLFTQDKIGCLRVERQDLEKYLQRVHTDNQRHVELVLPANIPPFEEFTDGRWLVLKYLW